MAGLSDPQGELCKGTGRLGPGLPLALYDRLTLLTPAPVPSVPMSGPAQRAGARISSALALHPGVASPCCKPAWPRGFPDRLSWVYLFLQQFCNEPFKGHG